MTTTLTAAQIQEAWFKLSVRAAKLGINEDAFRKLRKQIATPDGMTKYLEAVQAYEDNLREQQRNAAQGNGVAAPESPVIGGGTATGQQQQQQQPTPVTVTQPTPAQVQAAGDLSTPADEGVDETVDSSGTDLQKAATVGIVAGLTALAMQQGLQMVLQGALTSLLTLGQNEAQSAFNQIVNLTISQNPSLVSGWIWVCGGGACIACLEMDGSVHGNDENMDSHINCKCIQAAYNGPLPEDFLTGDQWFNQQSDLVQEEILGPSKYLAWKAGDVQLMDFIDHSDGYVSERSLKSLGLDYKSYLQGVPRASDFSAAEIQEAMDAATAPMREVEEFSEVLSFAPEFPEVPEITALESPEVQQLRADREALQTQRDAIQAKQDILSARWAKIVRETDFTEEDEAAAAEKKLAAIEKQQGNNITKMDKLDAKMRALDEKIAKGATAGTLEDVHVPFSDTIDIPSEESLFVAPGREEEKAETEIQKLLDQQNVVEDAGATKARIADDLASRLQGNAAFRQMASDQGYLEALNPNALSDFASELVKSWGAEYSIDNPLLIAEHMAARDEFGLQAEVLHADKQTIKAAQKYYKQYGEALRAFQRAQYDATQEWFASQGITEVDMYRGFHWVGDRETLLPQGVDWGTPRIGYADNGVHGTGEMAIGLNPMSSFTVDPSQAWSFAGSEDDGYHLVIGAKVPVERILGTAQTGYGSKGEAEMVVLGHATDTVKYDASVVRAGELVDEERVSDRLIVYHSGDADISVLAKPNGNFQVKYKPGEGGIGTATETKTVKSVAQVNKFLDFFGVGNIYKAPETAVAEAASAAGDMGLPALTYTLPEIDHEAEAAIIQQAQDALSSADGVASHTDAIELGKQIDGYLSDRIGPLSDYFDEVQVMREDPAHWTADQTAWYNGDLSQHGGLTIPQVEQQFYVAQRQETIRLLGEVRDLGQTDLTIADGADAQLAEAIQQMQDVLPRDWIEASNAQGELTIMEPDTNAQRGFYRADKQSGDGAIALRPDENPANLATAAIHELGHRMEDSVDGLWIMEADFYKARTAGEDLVDLSPELRVAGKTRVDKWALEYLGKDPIPVNRPGLLTDPSGERLRSVRGYELLSTGLEWLLGYDPRGAYFLAKDEEFHHWLLGVLAAAKDHRV